MVSGRLASMLICFSSAAAFISRSVSETMLR